MENVRTFIIEWINKSTTFIIELKQKLAVLIETYVLSNTQMMLKADPTPCTSEEGCYFHSKLVFKLSVLGFFLVLEIPRTWFFKLTSTLNSSNQLLAETSHKYGLFFFTLLENFYHLVLYEYMWWRYNNKSWLWLCLR